MKALVSGVLSDWFSVGKLKFFFGHFLFIFRRGGANRHVEGSQGGKAGIRMSGVDDVVGERERERWDQGGWECRGLASSL